MARFRSGSYSQLVAVNGVIGYNKKIFYIQLGLEIVIMSKNIKTNFIGRDAEKKTIAALAASKEAAILIVYGRRRVGKTELIEHTLGSHRLLKFEGIEGKNTDQQIQQVLYQLSKYLKDAYIAKLKLATWLELFDLIADKYVNQPCILYLEELQWLANYNSGLISELKYVWDNTFRHRQNFLLVLCGSSPSFMINQVVHSKALYNRSLTEIHLQEFKISEVKLFFAKCMNREVMNAYLTVGGIPEYLNKIKQRSSLFLGICENSFKKDSFFSTEYARIFISSFATSVHYKKLIIFLSQKRFVTRKEILAHLKLNSGGAISKILKDLEICGFIEKYRPYQVTSTSLLARYCIRDNYLQFYYKFIQPVEQDINNGSFDENPSHAINMATYQKWLGFAFERFCRRQHRSIAKILGFLAVKYRSGVFFNRNTEDQQPGFQIDLIFERADLVFTVCEIKYLQSKVNTEVIAEFETKLSLLHNPKAYTIEKVLISAEGATEALIHRGYFDRIITLDMLCEFV